MQRREFITLLGSVAAWPLIASAQQSERVRRIGVLLGSYTESDKAGQARIAAFLKALADLGWNADRNIRKEYRWGAGDTEQTTKLILETVRSAPDAIVATSDPVLEQLHRMTSTLPIIFTQISEPVETGLVASLARPGGNMTGFQNFEPAIGGKGAQPEARRRPGYAGCKGPCVIPGCGEAGCAISRNNSGCRRYPKGHRTCDSFICRPAGFRSDRVSAPEDDCKPQIDQ
jgi:hypothetical protein